MGDNAVGITVHNMWEPVGYFTDGSVVRAVRVFEDSRMVGRVVDMGKGGFRADFIDAQGDLCEVMQPDYYTAVMTIAEAAWIRHRVLH